ncbi:NAD(P)/FAD-dependent oxidoreductase [Brevibacillus marinus]|uniref:NAD(P)/FAD-dependent oxidoreductase n=1 Tax=Brevibacillus marinus TaxID=2496837 RepID=UPI000F820572|nr:FAD-binding oxidoreductase [Brevibacillus marinus]
MKYHVIVAGGGLIGTAATYYLARAGANVTLVEADDIAAGTSGACDRAIMLQSKAPGPLLHLALQSAKLYKELTEELAAELEYRECGGMILLESEQELEWVKAHVERQRQAGLNVQLLAAEEVRKRQPRLSAHIVGATWWEHDAEVNPLHLCFALARAAQRLGAKIRLGTPVTGLITEGERVVGVAAGGEKLYADAVVLALGVWTPQLLQPLQIDVPILPRRGQILVSERLPAFVSCNILGGSYIAAKMARQHTSAANPQGVALSLGQTGSGTLLIGGSREFAGYERKTSVEVTRTIAQTAVRFFPFLANVRILRTFAGLRPYTPDGMPIIGQVAERPGLYLAAGHEGDGVALSPITGKLIAEAACGMEPSIDLSPFSLSRFTTKANHPRKE